jgi:hypothetical protein
MDGSVPVGFAALDARLRCRHHRPPSEPSAPPTVTPTAAVVKPQPALSTPTDPPAVTAGGSVQVRVARDEGIALGLTSTVDVRGGVVVGNWLGDAARAAGTYSSPPRSLREPPVPAPGSPVPPGCGGFCEGGGVGWLLVPDGDGFSEVGAVGSPLSDGDGFCDEVG